MNTVHYVRALILGCLSLAGCTAVASPIEIRFSGNTQKDGNIKVNFKHEKNGITLTGLGPLSTKKGTKSKDILDIWRDIVEKSLFRHYYSATRTSKKSIESLMITPKAGTPNYNDIKLTKNSAEIPSHSVRVVSTKKGKSTLRFQDTGTLAPDGVTNWGLTVLTQDLQIFGSAFLELPNMAEPSLLLTGFATQLLEENIPISILDDALIMTSLQNNFFSINYDGDPKFIPLLANEVLVPEPKTVLLFFIGLITLFLALNATRTQLLLR